MRYRDLIRFTLPLAITAVIQESTRQILNGGMARMPQATETLAAFGLAWALVTFFASPFGQVKQLSLVLVNGRFTHRTTRHYVLLLSLAFAAIVASLALTPIGDWVIEVLHELPHDLAQTVRLALFWLIPYPLLYGLLNYYSGVLLRVRRTAITSYATLVSIATSIGAVFPLLSASFVHQTPIWLPLLVTYAGLLPELAIVLWGCWRYARSHLQQADVAFGSGGQWAEFGTITRFFWPLALIMVIQGFSRPLINLFIAREPGSEQALAVLTVVYALGHIPYGWVNELRSIVPAFQEMAGVEAAWLARRPEQVAVSKIRWFTAVCALLSLGSTLLLFWTPLRDMVVGGWIGLSTELLPLAKAPLMIFAFFPLAVATRAYLHGVGLVLQRTSAMAPSAPARLLAIFVALLILPLLNVHGAARAVAALYCGFWAETAVVYMGVVGRNKRF